MNQLLFQLIKEITGLSLEEINKIKETFRDSKQNDAERYKHAQEIKEKRKKYLEKVKKLKAERAPQEKILPKDHKGGKQGKNPCKEKKRTI